MTGQQSQCLNCRASFISFRMIGNLKVTQTIGNLKVTYQIYTQINEGINKMAYFYIVKGLRKFLWAGTWTLTVIGVLMVLRRIGIMAGYGKWLISPRFPF